MQAPATSLPPVWNLMEAIAVQTAKPTLPSLKQQLILHEQRFEQLERSVRQPSGSLIKPEFAVTSANFHQSYQNQPPIPKQPQPYPSHLQQHLLTTFQVPSQPLRIPIPSRNIAPPSVSSSKIFKTPAHMPISPTSNVSFSGDHHYHKYASETPLIPQLLETSYVHKLNSPPQQFNDNHHQSHPYNRNTITSATAETLPSRQMKLKPRDAVVDTESYCLPCGMQFSRKWDLWRHAKTRHSRGSSSGHAEKPYQCLKCGSRMSRADALKRHMVKNVCGGDGTR